MAFPKEVEPISAVFPAEPFTPAETVVDNADPTAALKAWSVDYEAGRVSDTF